MHALRQSFGKMRLRYDTHDSGPTIHGRAANNAAQRRSHEERRREDAAGPAGAERQRRGHELEGAQGEEPDDARQTAGEYVDDGRVADAFNVGV